MTRKVLVQDTEATPVQQFETEVKDFYAQDTDPGAVGTGSVWKDTNASPPTYWERNAANDGWDPIFDVFVGSVDDDAFARMRAYASGTGAANAGPSASTEGAGLADVRPTALSNLGGAYAGPSATAYAGSAQAGALAVTETGAAIAGPTATSTDSGDAHVEGVAETVTGASYAGSMAVRDPVTMGMYAEVDDNGVGKLGFNAVAASGGVTVPELPATPTEQDIVDVLVALGLVTQAAP